MTHEELQRAEVATGHWHYAEGHHETVRVIGLPYDYWYALGEADEQLEPDEQRTPLGQEGFLYYAHFADITGQGYPTIIQAKGFAQSMVQSDIEWN